MVTKRCGCMGVYELRMTKQVLGTQTNIMSQYLTRWAPVENWRITDPDRVSSVFGALLRREFSRKCNTSCEFRKRAPSSLEQAKARLGQSQAQLIQTDAQLKQAGAQADAAKAQDINFQRNYQLFYQGKGVIAKWIWTTLNTRLKATKPLTTRECAFRFVEAQSPRSGAFFKPGPLKM
jgi:hypothetical protein